MARLGAQVTSFDFSEKMIEIAKAKATEHADRIEYKVIDATDEEQLISLGERRFDAAVCMMGMMDKAAIESLVSALRQLLKADGRFVFSVMRPCFNSSRTTKIAGEEDRDGEIVQTYSIKVSEYIQPRTFKGLAIIGQPAPQYYFHRPISDFFNTCFRSGFVLDGIEEPTFEPGTVTGRAFSWANY